MNFKKLDQKTRDDVLKRDLSPDKIKIIEKFNLESTPELYWVSRKENSHEQIFFKHNFLVKNSVLRIVFRINRLCFAKVNYFNKNANKFEPQTYDFQSGFTETEWWNTEFLKHKDSGFQIDLRYLQTITDIEKFEELCAYLESLEAIS